MVNNGNFKCLICKSYFDDKRLLIKHSFDDKCKNILKEKLKNKNPICIPIKIDWTKRILYMPWA